MGRLVLYAAAAAVGVYIGLLVVALIASVHEQPQRPEVHVYIYNREAWEAARRQHEVTPVELAEAVRNGTLLVSPPAGPGLASRGEPRVPYPLWARMKPVDVSDPRVRGYLEWVLGLIREGARNPKSYGFDDAVVLPRRASLEPPAPIANATARIGTVLLPYGFAVTTVIYPCGPTGSPGLCAVVHMYAWNKTGLARMVVRAMGVEQLLAPPPRRMGKLEWFEKRILWVVEWPVDPRHSAVLAYNGSRVARVTRVYVVLEEPLIEMLGIPSPTGFLSRAAKWFWALSGVAGGIATWLSGAGYHEVADTLVRRGLLAYKLHYTYRVAWTTGEPYRLIQRQGGVCEDYALATLMLISGLGNEPAVLEVGIVNKEGHFAAGLLTTLVDCGLSTDKFVDLPAPLPVCTRGYVNYVDTASMPTSHYKRPVFVPPFLIPDALDYWFLWRGFVDKLPWWLVSPYAANTTLGREGTRFVMEVAANYSCTPSIAWRSVYPLAVGDVLEQDAGLARSFARYVNATPTGERLTPPPPTVYRAGDPTPPDVRLDYSLPGDFRVPDHGIFLTEWEAHQCPPEFSRDT
ncbi:hypothetical protein Pyrfu_0534 [Pyrolobus fumarii 1A]|uniref:Transglutaminase domain-containing protein n=1 Tax=Pyrolobus fumarii (strain DSM 11204 / 1A) TaxID=694429 RepID=G0EGN1_PYRF1|nr:hypothetical protein Pyrfu_0534 [Pyrolobus fumarii 1A]